jgi:nucleoside-diphosphate-sugar epimerase
LKESKVLITGGLGFIGSNLAQVLVQLGAKVHILDNLLRPYGGNINNVKDIRDKIKIYKEDVRNWSAIKKIIRNNEFDFIFHLAAQVDRNIALKNPKLDLEINCIGTLNILEACRLYSRKTKIIYTSSRAVIGEPKYLPVDEESPTNPLDVYGINKLAAEKYCMLYHKVYDLQTSILRLCNVYGPRAQLKYPHYGVLNLFIGYVLTNRPIPIYGNGSQTRDYVFVDDVIKALILAAENEKSIGKIFFVSSNEEIKLIDVAKMIIDIAKKGNYVFKPFPHILEKVDVKRFRASYSKIRRLLGWKPETTLNDGIARTIEFYKKNLKYYLP